MNTPNSIAAVQSGIDPYMVEKYFALLLVVFLIGIVTLAWGIRTRSKNLSTSSTKPTSFVAPLAIGTGAIVSTLPFLIHFVFMGFSGPTEWTDVPGQSPTTITSSMSFDHFDFVKSHPASVATRPRSSHAA